MNVLITKRELELSADIIPQLELLSYNVLEREDVVEFASHVSEKMISLLDTYQLTFKVVNCSRNLNFIH